MKKIAWYATILGSAAIQLGGCGDRKGSDPVDTANQAQSPAIEANAATSNALAPDVNALAAEEEAVPEEANDSVAARAEDSVAAAPAPAAEEPGSGGTSTKASAEVSAEPKATVERPKTFAMCMTCHSTGQGEAHKVGPNLFGVVGSRAGSKPGYAYSDAMKSSDITWTEARLMDYLLAPREMVPGTKMMIGGPKDEAARRAIVDYLATLK